MQWINRNRAGFIAVMFARELFQCSDIYDVDTKACLDLPVFVSHYKHGPLSPATSLYYKELFSA